MLKTYREWEIFWQTRRKVRGRVKVGNNTYLERTSLFSFTIVFHKTPIIEVLNDGSYVLRVGGHRTRSTKERLNSFSPAKVVQDKGKWFVIPFGRERVSFYDGIRVDGAGIPIELLKKGEKK